MTAESLILAAAMIPLASALATAAFGERLSRRTVVAFSLGTTVSTLAAGVALLWTLNISGTPHGVAPLGVWLELSHLKLVLSLRAQPSDVAVLVWTTSVVLVGQIAVAFRQQKRLHRSCAGLSLLGASVHWVILGDSMLLVFLGLQTFALATYLLLGFRFLSVERARTAQKTFIVHRIGAISFFLAMVILLHTSKTLELSSLAVALQGLGGGVVLDVASILVLLAGAALAAQLPLSTWLASASTGASRTWGAIHALALVAGVGVVRRLWPLVGQSETALLCLASVGTLSAFLFSTSASAQSDARRSLALAGGGFGGLAFAQCATRGVSSALFYAMAQGWAILCLVLVAGAVRWGTAGERDLRRMGGLRRVYPWLHRSALVVLILATLTPVSGDFGALGALEIPGLLMPLCSGLAVFSLWRWYLLTFWSGGSRTEAPANPVPVLPRILVLGAALVGVLPWSVSWLFAGGPRSLVAIGALATHALALGGSLFLYGRSIHRAAQTWVVQRPWRWLHRRAVSQWHLDELYETLFVQPFVLFSRVVLDRFVERALFQSVGHGLGRAVTGLGFVPQMLQSGNLQRYLAIFAISIAVLLYGWFMRGAPTAPPEPATIESNP